MMSEENYRYTIRNGVYGLPEKSSELKDRIRPGDRLVVYIKKSNCSELCQSFVAVLEVVSEWRESNKPMWPDEVRESNVLYPWVINVKPIAVGKVNFNDVKDELSRILHRNIDNPGKLRVHMRRGLPSNIGELIEGRLRVRAEAGGALRQIEPSHAEFINMVKDIGEWLGFMVETEYVIDDFRVDVAFFRKPRVVPFAVVEVHVGGDVYKDLASLKHAYDKYGSRPIYVVAKDEDKVMNLVNEAMEGAFHEIKDELIIVRAQELKQLHEALSHENLRRLINELMEK